MATATVIEALCEWRRSVAPLRRDGSAGLRVPAVASPGERGARWPFGPSEEDYLWRVVQDDSVVRSFDGVLVLGDGDPLLLETASARAQPRGRLRPPAEAAQSSRLEAAKLLLLEEEISLMRHESDSGSEASLAPPRLLRYLPGPGRERVEGRGRRGTAFVFAREAQSAPDWSKVAELPRAMEVKSSLRSSEAKPSVAFVERRSQPKPKSEVPEAASCQEEEEASEGWGAAAGHPPAVELMRVSATFRRFAMDGCVHRDDVQDALRRLGFRCVPEWVESAYSQVTRYATLDAAEFVLFVGAYEDRVRAAADLEFHKYDLDGSGVLDAAELAALLLDLGVEPMGHVLQEVLEEVDADGSGQVDFEEFMEVTRLIQEREGFTRREYEEFRSVFDLFDRDRTGEMDSQELTHVLSYLGYESSPEDLEMIIQEVDFDGTGSLDMHEFVVCMKQLRDRDMQALKAALVQHDLDFSGGLGPDELWTLMRSIGYLPDEEALNEIYRELEFDMELDFGMIWRFMMRYRQREGLSGVDLQRVSAAFAQYATGNEVQVTSIPKILRFLGYSIPYAEKSQLIKKVDIDTSGTLDVYELRKLCRICLEARTKLVQAAFGRYASLHLGVIPSDVVEEALRSVGCLRDGRLEPKLARLVEEPAGSMGGLDLRSFLRVASLLFKEMELEVQRNGGYSMDEIVEMRVQFSAYDRDGNGRISNSELVPLVRDVFPDMASDPRLRPQLLEVIREADDDGNGSLEFDDFLRLMRTVCDMRHRNQLLKEMRAKQETDFVPHEVAGFRELFAASANEHHLLSIEAFSGMIEHVCPLGNRNAQLLRAMWREALVVYEDCGAGEWVNAQGYEDRCELDFPEFLWVMRRVMDTNFGNVLERTKRYGLAAQATASAAQAAAASSSLPSARASRNVAGRLSRPDLGRASRARIEAEEGRASRAERRIDAEEGRASREAQVRWADGKAPSYAEIQGAIAEALDGGSDDD